MRHVVGSILISKYRSWCTLTFLKCVKKGKLCQKATLMHRQLETGGRRRGAVYESVVGVEVYIIKFIK